LINPKRILVVDDDPSIREMIASFLEALDYEIIEATDVASAMHELSKDAPFDLVILDFWLGKNHAVSIMDSIAFEGRDLPLIIISGGNGRMDLEKTEAISDVSGAIVFLPKPFHKAKFMDVVTSALK
jgi:two-component system phosphate regulon response regulator OmpR